MTMRWEQAGARGRNHPGKRWGHTLSVVSSSGNVYLFGGYDGKSKSQTNDVHVFNTARKSWSKIVVTGEPPVPRDSHTCTVVGSKLFVFGGTDGASPLNDLHVFDTTTNSWTQPVTTGEAPAAREGHSAALNGVELYVFGGLGREVEQPFNDLHSLNTSTYEWKEVITTGPAPCARDSHSLTPYRSKLILFGGEDASVRYLSDVHILHLDTLRWTPLETFGPTPPARAGHAAGCIGGNLFVFGGFAENRKLHDDFYLLDILTGVWRKAGVAGAGPSSRFSLATDLVDAENGVLVFYGGCNEELEALPEMFFLHSDIRPERTTSGSQHPSPEAEEEEVDEESSGRVEEDDRSSDEEEKEDLPVNGKRKANSALLPPDSGKGFSSGGTDAAVYFQAKLTDVFTYGYSLKTKIRGKSFRGLVFSYEPEFSPELTPLFRKNVDEKLQLEIQQAKPKPVEAEKSQSPAHQPLIMPDEYRELLGSSNNPFLNNLAFI